MEGRTGVSTGEALNPTLQDYLAAVGRYYGKVGAHEPPNREPAHLHPQLLPVPVPNGGLTYPTPCISASSPLPFMTSFGQNASAEPKLLGESRGRQG